MNVATPLLTPTVVDFEFTIKLTVPLFTKLLLESTTRATMLTLLPALAVTSLTVILDELILSLTVIVDFADDEE